MNDTTKTTVPAELLTAGVWLVLLAGQWRDLAGDLGEYTLEAPVVAVYSRPPRRFDGDDGLWALVQVSTDPRVQPWIWVRARWR